MKTFIFHKIAFQRNSKGFYTMMSCVMKGVYANKEKAIQAAEDSLNYMHETYGGIVTEKSKFDNEVYDSTIEWNDSKTAFIVTENEVKE